MKRNVSATELGRRPFLLLGMGLAGAAVLGTAGCSSSEGGASAATGPITGRPAGQGDVTLKVVGFRVSPEEKGSALDRSYQKFLTDFQSKYQWIKIDSLETPPDFDTQIVVDLASGLAPDLWSQDASSLAALSERKLLLDMRKCSEKLPDLDWDRFFPTVLDINKQADGAIYGIPNDFTPMVTYYNPVLFKKAGIDEPKSGWTWDDQLACAKALTTDASGRHAGDAGFDSANVKVWGYRASKNAYQWVYRLWQNGGDVLSPDRKTASGFLDGPASLEAMQWYVDLVRKHQVAPSPSTLDQITQKSSFSGEFVAGRFGMFDSGHWSLVGLQDAKGFDMSLLGVAPQPKKIHDATVLYESSFAVRHDLPEEKLLAVAAFVNEATSPVWQETKALTGIAIPANKAVAEASLTKGGTFRGLDKAFVEATAVGRPPAGSKLAKYPTVEKALDQMMEAMMRSGDVEGEAKKTVKAINQELEA